VEAALASDPGVSPVCAGVPEGGAGRAEGDQVNGELRDGGLHRLAFARAQPQEDRLDHGEQVFAREPPARGPLFR